MKNIEITLATFPAFVLAQFKKSTCRRVVKATKQPKPLKRWERLIVEEATKLSAPTSEVLETHCVPEAPAAQEVQPEAQA